MLFHSLSQVSFASGFENMHQVQPVFSGVRFALVLFFSLEHAELSQTTEASDGARIFSFVGADVGLEGGGGSSGGESRQYVFIKF